MHRKDRESRGGGVLIAVSNSVASSILPSPPELEIITVKFRINQFEAVICNCYIPPNTLFVTLLRYLSNLLSNHNRVIITGDFNLPISIGPLSLVIPILPTLSVTSSTTTTYFNLLTLQPMSGEIYWT